MGNRMWDFSVLWGFTMNCEFLCNLAKGFHQLVMAEESRELTTFIPPFGKFHFLRIPFGLRNAPAIFQQAMEVVLNPCKCVLDDVLIYSVS